MRSGLSKVLATYTLFFHVCTGFTVTTDTDATTLANTLFDGPGIAVVNASFEGGSVSSGTFTDGPLGIGDGVILTSGNAAGAAPGGTLGASLGLSGSTFCGDNTHDAAVLTVGIDVQSGYEGVLVDFIYATQEYGGSYDPMAVWLDGVQYANDNNGLQISSGSELLDPPTGIVSPNTGSQYPRSTQVLSLGILAASGQHIMVFAICDYDDDIVDSGLLVKAQGCSDCPSEISPDYVTSTTTVAAGSTAFTSTIPASGSVIGTVLVGVEAPTSTSYTSTAETTTVSLTPTPTPTPTPGSTTSLTPVSTPESTPEPTSTVSSAETPSSTPSETTIESTPQTTIETTSSEVMTTSATSTVVVISSPPPVLTTEISTPEISTTPSLLPPNLNTIITPTVLESSTTESSLPLTPTISTTSSQSLEIVTTPTSTILGTHSSIIQMSSQELPSFTSSIAAAVSSLARPLNTTSQPPSSSTTSATTTSQASSSVPSNIPLIGRYVYAGCLGSSGGYPSFNAIGTDPDMTTSDCISLAQGRKYVGLYDRSCYAADTLDDADFVRNGRCDLPCPGDPGLFCGGTVSSAKRSPYAMSFERRDAPPNILLTIYALNEAASGSSSELLVATTTSTSSAVISDPVSTTSQSEPLISPSPSRGASLLPASTINENVTDTVTAIAVTTVTRVAYTTVNPFNPSHLTVTHVYVTLEYYPCGCRDQQIPTVEMTTLEVQCQRCGDHGESVVTLTVPMAAIAATTTVDVYPYKSGTPLEGLPDSDPAGANPSGNSLSMGDGDSSQHSRTTRKLDDATMSPQPTGFQQTLEGVVSSAETGAPTQPTVVTAGGKRTYVDRSQLTILASIAFIFIAM